MLAGVQTDPPENLPEGCRDSRDELAPDYWSDSWRVDRGSTSTKKPAKWGLYGDQIDIVRRGPSGCSCNYLFYLVGTAGFEPATHGLKGRCSTD